MEKGKMKVSITCPYHKDQLLERVNPDLSAQKHVYCVECLMQTEDPKAAYANFPKISDFLSTLPSTSSDPEQAKSTPEVPREFLNVTASQAENLDKLSKHIDEEKKKIESFFENVTNVIVNTISQLKKEHLEMLDKQVANLQNNYADFEKTIKRLYPKKEDIDMDDIDVTFSTDEDLEERLSKIKTALDLEEFMKKIKQTKAETVSGNSSEELKLNCLKSFSNALKNIERNKPTFEETGANLLIIKEGIQRCLGLGNAFTLNNPVSKDLVKQSFSQSTIASLQEIQILKNWLPEGNTFNSAPLYRMTRDGRSSEAFHSRCDHKGSTITLIKCRYNGASQTSIIGGYSDRNFDQYSKGFVSSNQAFIFSFTPQIKCHILQPQHAMWNGNGQNIWFGYSGTLGVSNNLTEGVSYIHPPVNNTYADSYRIIPSECYEGPGKQYDFDIEEIEVYQVK